MAESMENGLREKIQQSIPNLSEKTLKKIASIISESDIEDENESREYLETQNREITKKIQRVAFDTIKRGSYNGKSSDGLPRFYNSKVRCAVFHGSHEGLHSLFGNPRFIIQDNSSRMDTTVTVVMKEIDARGLMPLEADITTRLPVYNKEKGKFEMVSFDGENAPNSDEDLKNMVSQKRELYSELLKCQQNG